MTREDVRPPLPAYERPPVNEVVCGVLFQDLDALLAPHLGLLWQRFGPEYSRCEEVPILAPVVEQIEATAAPALTLRDVPPLPRVWFLHEDQGQIIQVQRDRFLYNWRRVSPETTYPHYGNVVQRFELHLDRFRAFLRDYGLGDLHLRQFELTYIDQISQGQGWESLAEIGNVFPDFTWRQGRDRFTPAPESINLRVTLPLPNQAGRVHVSVRNAVRVDNGQAVLVLDMTARGIWPARPETQMREWFDLAHEFVVRSFTDLTSATIQQEVWRRAR